LTVNLEENLTLQEIKDGIQLELEQNLGKANGSFDATFDPIKLKNRSSDKDCILSKDDTCSYFDLSNPSITATCHVPLQNFITSTNVNWISIDQLHSLSDSRYQVYLGNGDEEKCSGNECLTFGQGWTKYIQSYVGLGKLRWKNWKFYAIDCGVSQAELEKCKNEAWAKNKKGNIYYKAKSHSPYEYLTDAKMEEYMDWAIQFTDKWKSEYDQF